MDNGLDKAFNSDLSKDWNWEEVGTQMALAFVSTGISQGATSGFNSLTNKTDNQTQVEGLQQEIAKKTEELNNSQDAREKQIIQETINGLNEELNELRNKIINLGDTLKEKVQYEQEKK